jgi:hypothetical protein
MKAKVRYVREVAYHYSAAEMQVPLAQERRALARNAPYPSHPNKYFPRVS